MNEKHPLLTISGVTISQTALAALRHAFGNDPERLLIKECYLMNIDTCIVRPIRAEDIQGAVSVITG